MSIFFRLPGDDGKRKASMLRIKKIWVPTSSDDFTDGSGLLFIAACPAIVPTQSWTTADLPMGKKKECLCTTNM